MTQWSPLPAAALRGMRIMAVLALVGLGGCLVVADRPNTGYLTVNWSIEGTYSPSLCGYYVVDAMEVVVYDRYGDFVTEVEAVCEAFGVSIELYPGFYTADVTLVGFRDEAATVTHALYDLRVARDSDLVVDIDFPPSSFF